MCLGIAALVVVDEVRPAEPIRAPVLTLAAPRPAGSTLAAADLVLRAVPPDAVPDGAYTDPDEAIGARLAVGLPAGFPIGPSLLAGPGLAAGAPPGTVVAPVRLSDAGLARLLRAGDRLDLHRAPSDGGGGPSSVLARSALVLAGAQDDSVGFLDTTTETPLLLVAVSEDVATLVTGAGGWSPLGAVLVGGAGAQRPTSPDLPGGIP